MEKGKDINESTIPDLVQKESEAIEADVVSYLKSFMPTTPCVIVQVVDLADIHQKSFIPKYDLYS
jgi:hypothetical protein